MRVESLVLIFEPRVCMLLLLVVVCVQISDRSSMDPTTKEREVTISGPYPNLKLAEAMVQEKLLQSRARSTARADSVASH